jgi:hypothetical protein
VLSSIFSAYAYEESILQLSNRLLERSLFVSVKQSVELRQRGWRPKGSTCEACGRRVWGPGVAGNVFEAWEEKKEMDERRRNERKALSSGGSSDRGKGKDTSSDDDHGRKGKGKGKEPIPNQPLSDDRASGEGMSLGVAGQDTSRGDVSPHRREQVLGPLVVLACRHIYHQSCLEALQAREEGRPLHLQHGRDREYRCPIDG